MNTETMINDVIEGSVTNMDPKTPDFDKEAWAEKRFKKFLNAIFCICDISGFHIEERIVVKDLKADKVWR